MSHRYHSAIVSSICVVRVTLGSILNTVSCVGNSEGKLSKIEDPLVETDRSQIKSGCVRWHVITSVVRTENNFTLIKVSEIRAQGNPVPISCVRY